MPYHSYFLNDRLIFYHDTWLFLLVVNPYCYMLTHIFCDCDLNCPTVLKFKGSDLKLYIKLMGTLNFPTKRKIHWGKTGQTMH